MANHQRSNQKTRRRRKLHNIPQSGGAYSKNPALFWYSYKSALTWIRNHEDVICKCVQLLQIYPNLIQDASMDQFWEFIESLVHDDNADTNEARQIEGAKSKGEVNSVQKLQEKDNSVKGSDIPQISVTASSSLPSPTFTISAQHARTPRVHMISRRKGGGGTSDDKDLHVGVIDMLQEDFYIRVTNATHQSQHVKSKDYRRQYILAESDVCVYLFNDATLEDADCFHDLCVALAHKIPVVYVRYHKKELPKSFSETININSKGCITLKDYMSKLMPLTHSASSTTLLVKNIRVRKKLAPLIVGKRSKSASDLYMRPNDVPSEKRCSSTESLEIDLVLTLVSSFKNACVFDEADLFGCSSRLRQEIHRNLGIYESKPASLSSYSNNGNFEKQGVLLSSYDGRRAGNIHHNKYLRSAKSSADFATLGRSQKTFLTVPDPEDLRSTREWGHLGSMPVTAEDQQEQENNSNDFVEGNTFFDSDARIASSPTLEQKASTYLIFQQNKAPDGPRKVEFPTEVDNVAVDSELESDDYNSVRESPISFHEIDLSREINTRETPESDASSVS